MFSLEALFCHVDDFCTLFEAKWHQKLLEQGLKSRNRSKSLALSEIMTILIAFHQNHYRNFKHYYLDYVSIYWREAFPGSPRYQRFALMDALHFSFFVCLSQTLFRSMHRKNALSIVQVSKPVTIDVLEAIKSLKI